MIKVVGYFDLSIMSMMSVMGLKKKFGWRVGWVGWVGWGGWGGWVGWVGGVGGVGCELYPIFF